jgi:hypothetical protein
VRVDKSNADEEGAGDNAQEVDPELLDPDVREALVEEVGAYATERSGDDVEEAEHGCPLATGGLAESFEVLLVVCTEDRVDGEFCTEGVEVARSLSAEGTSTNRQ